MLFSGLSGGGGGLNPRPTRLCTFTDGLLEDKSLLELESVLRCAFGPDGRPVMISQKSPRKIIVTKVGQTKRAAIARKRIKKDSSEIAVAAAPVLVVVY